MEFLKLGKIRWLISFKLLYLGIYKGDKTMTVDRNKCVGCGSCMGACPVGAISMVDGKAKIDKEKCIGCQTCVAVCPVEAISND